MASLGFDLLDRHVVAGRADATAVGTLTYARLLERSAAVAAGLRVLGVQPGDEVAVRLDGEDRVVVVAACIRLGALPGDAGAHVVSLDDGTATVTVGDEVHPLDLVRRAGSGDPATALADDAPGYRDQVLGRVGDVVTPLLAGDAVRV